MSPLTTSHDCFDEAIAGHLAAIQALGPVLTAARAVAERMIESLNSGGKIFWMGNGGSAADSQHLAAELVGRFRRERRAIASIALTTDTSILTALGNDYSYDIVFSRQVEALCGPRDVAVGISTSGNSANVNRALRAARSLGAWTVGFTGRDGGEMASIADVSLIMPSHDTARIQEAYMLVGHAICDAIEAYFFEREPRPAYASA